MNMLSNLKCCQTYPFIKFNALVTYFQTADNTVNSKSHLSNVTLTLLFTIVCLQTDTVWQDPNWAR